MSLENTRYGVGDNGSCARGSGERERRGWHMQCGRVLPCTPSPIDRFTKGHDTCRRFQRKRLPFRAEEGAPCHFFHPAAPLSARACRRALACAQAPPPWHALPLRRIRLRMHNSTAPPYPDPRDPATDSAAPTALLTAAASLPCARRGLSATMFKNTFQSGFLSILYSIGACTLCFKTPRGRHLPQGTHTPPQSSRRPRQRTLAHPARLLASLSRPPVCANLPAARRLQAVADLGEGGAQWSHQAHHRQRHPVVRS